MPTLKAPVTVLAMLTRTVTEPTHGAVRYTPDASLAKCTDQATSTGEETLQMRALGTSSLTDLWSVAVTPSQPIVSAVRFGDGRITAIAANKLKPL